MSFTAQPSPGPRVAAGDAARLPPSLARPPHRTDRHRGPRARCGHRARRRRLRSARRGQHLVGDPRAASAAPARPTRGPSPSRGRSASSLHLARQPRGVSSASGTTTAAPASAIQRALALWWSADACGIRDEDRRAPVGGDLEDRAAGARDARGRRPAAPRRTASMYVAQVVVAGAGRRARSASKSRAPAACRTRNGAPANASTAASLIERAPSEPPKTSTQRVVRRRARTRARAAARSVAGGGTGRPGDEVARARRGPSIGKARQTRRAKRREQAVGRARGGCRPRSARAGRAARTAASPTGPAT